MKPRKPISRLPKCPYHKTRFIPKWKGMKFCLSDEACKVAATAFGIAEVKKKAATDWKKEKATLKPFTHSKEYKADLQREINKLARMIDTMFGFTTCIDCGRAFGNQCDAAHFNGVGSNHSIRYNLHNLHSAASYCNQFSDKHHSGYVAGLQMRYGKSYLELVEGLPTQYPKVKLSEVEVVEKLKIVRKLIRDFDTFQFENSIQARQSLNTIIGIYK